MEMATTLGAICNPEAPRPTAAEAARTAFLLCMVSVSLVPSSMICLEVVQSLAAQDMAIRRQFCERGV